TIINIPFGRPDVPPSARPQPQAGRVMRVVLEDAGRLHVPSRIPQGIKPEQPSEAAQQAAPLGIGTGLPFGDRNMIAVLNLPPTAVAPPPKPAPETNRIIVSRMEPGALVHQVQPVYPPQARLTRVKGVVQLDDVIGRAG